MLITPIHTDASKDGLGTILYQTQDDGTDRVIAYASHSLKKSEQKYHSSKINRIFGSQVGHNRPIP